jgi:glycosyltransferase involved in cell wall biosynthesis
LGYPELLEKYGDLNYPLEIETLSQGHDYEFAPGGVTAMIYPLIERMVETGHIEKPIWISLGPNAPKEVNIKGIKLYNIQLEPQYIRNYSNFKESIWREMHSIGSQEMKIGNNLSQYEAYNRYNYLVAQLMMKLLPEVDLFFVHDFQQLQVGHYIGPAAPCVLRWHIPFKLENLDERLRRFILKNIEGFDSIIVSTRRDLEGLIQAGYRGRAYQVYPYIDLSKWKKPTKSEKDEFSSKFRLQKDDFVILKVARMDPIKGQDIVIKAIAPLIKKHKVKLLLIGNGSFSGSQKGGLSLPKSELWRDSLNELIQDLGIQDSVILTGFLHSSQICTAYDIANLVVLSSRAEGFGLLTLEGWVYKKPVIVSKGAGSAELIIEGVNGYTFNQDDWHDLKEKIEMVINNQENAQKMGENGFESAKQCYIERSIEKDIEIFKKTIEFF